MISNKNGCKTIVILISYRKRLRILKDRKWARSCISITYHSRPQNKKGAGSYKTRNRQPNVERRKLWSTKLWDLKQSCWTKKLRNSSKKTKWKNELSNYSNKRSTGSWNGNWSSLWKRRWDRRPRSHLLMPHKGSLIIIKFSKPHSSLPNSNFQLKTQTD